MAFAESLLLGFLSSGLWVVVIGFFGRSLIGNLLAKDIEHLKGKIAAQNIEKGIVLARVHERRAEAVGAIYQALVKYLKETKQFVYQAEHVNEDERRALLEAMENSSSNFGEVFQNNHLYLSKATCKSIKDVFSAARLPFLDFTYKLSTYKHTELQTDKGYIAEWEKAFETLADKMPVLLAGLEDEFRSLLGVEA